MSGSLIPQVIIDMNELDMVHSYICMGQGIVINESVMKEINNWIQLASSAFGRISTIFNSDWEKKVFDQCILPL